MAYLYYKYEVNKEPAEEMSSKVTIIAKEKNKNVVTGYIIKINNVFYKEGVTLEQAPILIKAPVNSSVSVINKNLQRQNYYITKKEVFLGDITAKRLELNLVAPGSLTCQEKEYLDKNLKIKVVASGEARNLIACIDWTSHVISGNIIGYDFIEIPANYKKDYIKCYDLNKTVVDNNFLIETTYEKFGTIDNDDRINILFIDRDYYNNILISQDNGKDLFMEDYLCSININNI